MVVMTTRMTRIITYPGADETRITNYPGDDDSNNYGDDSDMYIVIVKYSLYLSDF